MRLYKLYTDLDFDKQVLINETFIKAIAYVPERDVPVYSPDPNVTDATKIVKDGNYLAFDVDGRQYFWPGTLEKFKETDAYNDYLNIEII